MKMDSLSHYLIRAAVAVVAAAAAAATLDCSQVIELLYKIGVWPMKTTLLINLSFLSLLVAAAVAVVTAAAAVVVVVVVVRNSFHFVFQPCDLFALGIRNCNSVLERHGCDLSLLSHIANNSNSNSNSNGNSRTGRRGRRKEGVYP